jgi:hypothetical protein
MQEEQDPYASMQMTRRKMNGLFTLAALAMPSVTLVGCAGDGESNPPAPPSGDCVQGANKQVLYIGNSQLVFQNLPMLVESLANSTPSTCPRIVGTQSFANNLRDAWRSPDILTSLRSGQFNTVVLAESLSLIDPQDSDYPAAFETHARLFVSEARRLGIRPILYATPALRGEAREGSFRSMADLQIPLARSLGVQIATGGLAWLRVWQALPTLELFDPDGIHPGYFGAVISALTLYAVINQASPLGLVTMPATDYCGSNCPLIADSLAGLFQQSALAEYQVNGR